MLEILCIFIFFRGYCVLHEGRVAEFITNMKERNYNLSSIGDKHLK